MESNIIKNVYEIMGIDGAKLILKYDKETDLYGFGRAEPVVGEDDGYTYFSEHMVIGLIHLLIDMIENDMEE